MNNLFKLYHPITQTPLSHSETYIELPPCEALAPYICCYWGTYNNITTIASGEVDNGIVIPDTCMDIIFDVNFTNNRISNTFCGIQNRSFISSSPTVSAYICSFAIRFYAWAVILFADEDMKTVLNTFNKTDYYFKFLKENLESVLIDTRTIEERIKITESYLLRRINKNRENPNVMNAIYKILNSKGNIRIKELADYASVSSRQLERLFKETTGISPKQLADLVRYQYLWQDIIYCKDFDIQDAVLKYGYCDQAHLLNDFRNYHTMTPIEAKTFALNGG